VIGQPISALLAAVRGAEVFVLEAVGIAFEAEDLGVVDEPVDHRGGDDLDLYASAP
jgi:hypothetical protein